MESSNTTSDDCFDDRSRLRGFWDIKPRRLVLMASAFAFATALSIAQVDRVFIAVILVSIAALKIFNISTRLLALVFISLIAGFLSAELRLPAPGKADISRFSGKYLLIRGTISQTSSLATGNGLRLVINCRAARESILPVSLQNVPDEGFAPVEGNLQAIVYTCRRAALNSAPKNMLPPAQINLPFAPGDCILLRGKVINLACAPGERLKHIAFLLRRQAVFCQLVTTKANIVLLYHGCLPQANWLDSQAVYWRQALVQFHRSALGVHDGDLLSSMVLGDRAVSPEREIVDNFRASGLSHILAASGFNLSIVATSIYFVLRFCTGNLWAANSLCLIGMVIYVFVAGPSPSVMRAFLMGALLLLSRCLVRTLHMPAALAAAMFLVLLIDPWSAADVGFQLSYFSTAGMILGAASFTQLLVGTCNKCPKWIVIILSATLVAQACVLPLQLYYFGQFTPYCLIANILVSPAVAPLTVLGFADSLLYVSESFVFSPHILSACLAKVCYLPLEVMRRLVAGIASCPLAQINTGQAELAAVLLYYFVLLLFPLLALKARGRLWSLLFAMSFLTLIATIAGPAKEDSYSRNKAAPAQVRSGTGLKKQSRFLQ